MKIIRGILVIILLAQCVFRRQVGVEAADAAQNRDAEALQALLKEHAAM